VTLRGPGGDAGAPFNGWAVFAEYNHYNFGGTVQTVASRSFGGSFSEDYQVKALNIDTVKFGVNYRLNMFGS